jgi:hypothetical protein
LSIPCLKEAVQLVLEANRELVQQEESEGEIREPLRVGSGEAP